jgi:hypothetical protein
VLNLGKVCSNRKNVKEKMKGEVVAARADGSVIMQWQRGGKCVILLSFCTGKWNCWIGFVS